MRSRHLRIRPVAGCTVAENSRRLDLAAGATDDIDIDDVDGDRWLIDGQSRLC
ncbi:MAG: hypothetical protein J2O49_11795 [Sciscionella sp.]|nr:hypothetical protein [Sciscionella sp.]